MNALYPPRTAHSWDSVGLIVGDPEAPVNRVHFAVDPTVDVVVEAIEAGADLLVTHHPLMLRGVNSVALTSAKGEVVHRAIRGGLALFNAHTNADDARPGVSDALARTVGLDDLRPLSPATDEGTGTGRIGTLPESRTLEAFAMLVAEALPFTPQGIRVAGDLQEPVRTVAVCGGSGDSLFEQVRAAGVDVYLTADLRHHPALEERELSRGDRPFLIDAAHWATEWPWLHGAASRVQGTLMEQGASVEVCVSELRTDPWTLRLPSSGGLVR